MGRWLSLVTRKLEGQSATPPKKFPEGLTVVHNEPDAIADIIFVHGLTGHPFKSWAAAEDKPPWIETLLPGAVSRVRILTYGYHTELIGKAGTVSHNSLWDHAGDLLRRIDRDETRESDKEANKPRPVIFVCHSLGGLLVQLAFVRAKGSEEHQNLLPCVLGVAFMGTPMRGSENDMVKTLLSLHRMLGILQETNTKITPMLRKDSELLLISQDSFHALRRVERSAGGLKGMHVICFIEQLALGSFGIIVDKRSATIDGSTPETIHGNHKTMVQFSSASDVGFTGVTCEINKWLKGLTTSLSPPRPMTTDRAGRGTSGVTNDITRTNEDTNGGGTPSAGEPACSLSRDSTFATLINSQAGGPPFSFQKSFQTAEDLKISFRTRLKDSKIKSANGSSPPAPTTSELHGAIMHYREAIRLSGINNSTQSIQPFNSNRPWRDGEEIASRIYARSCLGIADCHRELTHRKQVSYKDKIQYLDSGIWYLHKAFQESSSGLLRSTSLVAVGSDDSWRTNFSQPTTTVNGNREPMKAITWLEQNDVEYGISDVSSTHTTSRTANLDTVSIVRSTSSSPLTAQETPPSPQVLEWTTLLLRVKIERAMLLARQTVIYETEGPGQIQARALPPVIEGTADEQALSKRGRSGGKIATLEQVSEGRTLALRELDIVIEQAIAMGREDFVKYVRRGVKSLTC